MCQRRSFYAWSILLLFGISTSLGRLSFDFRSITSLLEFSLEKIRLIRVMLIIFLKTNFVSRLDRFGKLQYYRKFLCDMYDCLIFFLNRAIAKISPDLYREKKERLGEFLGEIVPMPSVIFQIKFLLPHVYTHVIPTCQKWVRLSGGTPPNRLEEIRRAGLLCDVVIAT